MIGSTDRQSRYQIRKRGPTRSDTGTLEYQTDVITGLLIPCLVCCPDCTTLDRRACDTEDDSEDHQAEESRVGHMSGLVVCDIGLNKIGVGSLVLN